NRKLVQLCRNLVRFSRKHLNHTRKHVRHTQSYVQSSRTYVRIYSPNSPDSPDRPNSPDRPHKSDSQIFVSLSTYKKPIERRRTISPPHPFTQILYTYPNAYFTTPCKN